MKIDDLKTLLANLKADPTQVTADDLAAARDAIQAHRDDVAAAIASGTPVTAETKALLTELVEIRTAVAAEQDARAATAAEVNAEAERLLSELDAPDPESGTEQGDQGDGTDSGEGDTGAEQTPQLEAVAASGDLAKAVAAAVTAAFAAQAKTPAQPEPVVGRTARRINPAGTAPVPAAGEVIRTRTYSGQDAAGSPLTSNLDLAKTLHEKFRTAYQDSAYSGRMPVAHVAVEYPESRTLGQNLAENWQRLEDASNPKAIVAAGGLCAPLETLYDIDDIGSAARPIKDQALQGFQVERGGLTYRPNTSAATAVHGAGQWTMDDDQANDGREKACYVVDCPGLESEYVWAAYSCLEFSNITTRFDPEVTTSNIKQGSIAHARLADNLLYSKMAAQSKLLTSTRVIGATRDLLVNIDKVSAYYRNRHRIDSTLPLNWLAPAWVKFLMRADLARQMAAGDWKEALAPADSLINSWFAARDVTPIWHMDGIAGTDEVQTVTITGTPTGGTFTLTYAGQTTAPIAYNATAAQVRSALAALNNLHAEDITVTGGPGPGTAYTVTFGGGEVDGVNVAQMTSAGSFTGGSSPAVAVATTTGGDGAITVNGVTIPAQTYDNAIAGDQIPGFPDKIDSLLYTPGSWLFLDGGSLDLGLVRDSALNARNRYRQFMETFEGAAFRGIESLRLVMPVQPTGQTAGTKDLDAIAD